MPCYEASAAMYLLNRYLLTIVILVTHVHQLFTIEFDLGVLEAPEPIYLVSAITLIHVDVIFLCRALHSVAV